MPQKDKTSRAAYNKRYNEENRDKILKQKAEYYAENKDKRKDYRAANKEHLRVYYSARNKRNRAATPKWASLECIMEFYSEAKRLTELTGIQMHVDHVIPLRGKLVSGLHVEYNLQIIPGVINMRKSNRYGEFPYGS